MNNTKINIGHIGLWVKNLETMRDFYVDIMGGNCGEKYSNPRIFLPRNETLFLLNIVTPSHFK